MALPRLTSCMRIYCHWIIWFDHDPGPGDVMCVTRYKAIARSHDLRWVAKLRRWQTTWYTVCRRPWCFKYMAWILLSFESVFPLVFGVQAAARFFFSAIPLVFTLCKRHSIVFYDESPLFVNAETTCVLAFWLRSSNFFEVLSESLVVFWHRYVA